MIHILVSDIMGLPWFVQIMGRYLSGLCQAGIWCCFDEFNRIDIEVLSVISQQLQSIKNAKDQHRTRSLIHEELFNFNVGVVNCLYIYIMCIAYNWKC